MDGHAAADQVGGELALKSCAVNASAANRTSCCPIWWQAVRSRRSIVPSFSGPGAELCLHRNVARFARGPVGEFGVDFDGDDLVDAEPGGK
ncbi:hypothetical protein [Streptodolium elevatio]